LADPVLKFPPEQKGNPPQAPREKISAQPRRRLMAALRRYRRTLLLVVLPLAAVIAGLIFYLNGGVGDLASSRQHRSPGERDRESVWKEIACILHPLRCDPGADFLARPTL